MRTATTLGIDLSSQAANTAACVVSWSGVRAVVAELRSGLDDDALIELARSVDKVGIDVPLGWPRRLVEAVAAHAQGRGWPGDYQHSVHARQMRWRATDRYVAERFNQQPLSVAADRIALPAMRAAWLVPRLEDARVAGATVDLSGAGKVVEVYPALALRCWGLTYRGYKGRQGAAVRSTLVENLARLTSAWLEFRVHRAQLEQSDDALDSLIAALVARAHQRGRCDEIPAAHRDDARREGWIAVPTAGALDDLGG